MKLLFAVLLLLVSKNYEPHHLICTGKYSKSYHKDYKYDDDYCKGLKSCKADIIRLPRVQAISLRSDPCDFCYGH
jgi:hypothetical protein